MKTKIVLIDDDPITNFLHKTFLEKSGFTSNPLIFTSGSEAVKFLHSLPHPQHFLILLDINMPIMNGWEFLDTMNQSSVGHKITVIIVTSSINRSDKEIASNYQNIIEFIEKPINIPKLKELQVHPAITTLSIV